MEDKRPKQITISNLRYYFDFKPVSLRGGLQPGMLVEFNYSSPSGVHDRKPLIYVMQVEGDRVYGLNLHYRFNLTAQIVESKKQEVLSYLPKQAPQKEVSKDIPDVPTVEKDIKQPDLKNIKLPPQVLEKYLLSSQPSDILRNYLYSRITSPRKLVYKPV